MEVRDILCYFSYKYKGNWNDIYRAIKCKEPINYDEYQKIMENSNYNAITILDEIYPEQFKNVEKPPFVVFYYGDISLLKSPMISVIGTRRPSEFGIVATKKVVKHLVSKNYVIVSGLACGIDGVAHKAAIDEGGKTIAILGSGIDLCYPKSNMKLYNEIRKNHLVLSEYPIDILPQKINFPFRNRLIASLGEKIVVTEAYANSGTSITVNYGLQMNRDICCISFPAFAHSFNNTLIKEGATLIDDVDDLL